MTNSSKQKNNRKRALTIFLVCVLLFAIAALVIVPTIKKQLYPIRYAEYVEEYSETNGLDPLLVYAVICTESGFDAQAESAVGARGLMQITDETYQWIKLKIEPNSDISFDDMYLPEYNIQFGSYFFARCIDRYGDLPTAIAAYHSGWGTVDALLQDEEYSSDGVTLQVFPYPQMERYVQKVTHAYEVYKDLYE